MLTRGHVGGKCIPHQFNRGERSENVKLVKQNIVKSCLCIYSLKIFATRYPTFSPFRWYSLTESYHPSLPLWPLNLRQEPGIPGESRKLRFSVSMSERGRVKVISKYKLLKSELMLKHRLTHGLHLNWRPEPGLDPQKMGRTRNRMKTQIYFYNMLCRLI